MHCKGTERPNSLDVTIIVSLRKKERLTSPRAETPAFLISIGSKPDANLNQTLEIALGDMLRWLIEEKGMKPAEAHLLIGVSASLDLVTLGGSTAVRIPRRQSTDINPPARNTLEALCAR